MDYKEGYENAIKRAKAMLEVAANREEALGYVSTIFPELSKDEKIRKAIISVLEQNIRAGFDHSDGFKFTEMITWLEKQGLKYKDGEIVKTQRRIAAEAKEALFDDEDEKMISALLEGFKHHQLFNPTFGGVPDTEIIAWLEKQGEQKDAADSGVEKEKSDFISGQSFSEQEPVGETEPKFKVGDLVLHRDSKDTIYRIKKVYWGYPVYSYHLVPVNAGIEIPYTSETNVTLWVREQKYEEALERAKEILKKDLKIVTRATLETVFPELVETDDERMLREIKKYLKETKDIPVGSASVHDMLQWLGDLHPVRWSDRDDRLLEEAVGMVEANGTWVRSADAVKEVATWLKGLEERYISLDSRKVKVEETGYKVPVENLGPDSV